MKIKILLGLVFVLLIGVQYLYVEEDDYRKKEVKTLKKTYLLEKMKKCLKKQKSSIKNATNEQKAKCKLIVDAKWEEIKVMNSQY